MRTQRSAHVVEDGLGLGVELSEEVEVGEVAGEDGAAVSFGGEEDQGVVECAALLGLAVVLEAGEQAGEDAGFAPGFTVGGEDAVLGALVDGGGDLGDDAGSLGVRGVEQAGEGGEFGFRDRRVPEAGGAEGKLGFDGQTALQSVDIDGGVEKQLGQRRLEAGEKW